MQKVCLSLLSLALFSACSAPNPDFIALENVLTRSETEIVGMGGAQNVFVKIPATDEIKDIAARNKKTSFWSGLESGDIIDHVDNETCLIDAKLDYAGKCPYRVYCGGAVELMIAMATNAKYASEICK